jgi:hypothetical protein
MLRGNIHGDGQQSWNDAEAGKIMQGGGSAFRCLALRPAVATGDAEGPANA